MTFFYPSAVDQSLKQEQIQWRATSTTTGAKLPLHCTLTYQTFYSVVSLDELEATSLQSSSSQVIK